MIALTKEIFIPSLRFLLARLHLESLADKTTVKAVKQALKDLPRGEGALNHAYEDTLTRIESQMSGFASLARKTLMWIVYAQRELTVEELRYALAIEENSSELDEENLEDTDQIISACKGLVTLDHETEIVRLVHYTTQEYLKRILPCWNPDAQETITKACLQYLSFRSIRSSLNGEHLKSPLSDEAFNDYVKAQYQDHVLLRYVVGHCVSHAKCCWNEAIENLILKWLCNEQTVASYLEDFVSRLVQSGALFDRRTNNTALHMSAVFDCEAVTAKLLSDSRVNVNATNTEGETALHTAANYGRNAIAIRLLDRDDIEVNVRDASGSTPFILAAQKKYEDIAVRLLRRDDLLINLQETRWGHNTALHRAAWSGLEVLAKLLLQRAEVKINLQGRSGSTPLMYAVEKGHQAIVELLLEKDEVLINLRTRTRGTALILSAAFNRGAICEMILKRDDVQVNLNCSFFGTALSRAAALGNHAIVRLLLQRNDIQVNVQDESDDGTALTMAIHSGHEDIVGLLLQRKDVKVDLNSSKLVHWPACYQRYYGLTPLALAAREGQAAMTRLLLLRDDIDVNMRCDVGGTALMYAARYGRGTLVRLMLQRPEIQVNLQDSGDVTEVEYPFDKNVWRKIRMGVQKGDDTYKLRVDGHGTALMYAAAYGHGDVVRILLEKEGIRMDCRDRENRTALMLAYNYGYEDIVDIFERAGASGEIPSADERIYSTEHEDLNAFW